MKPILSLLLMMSVAFTTAHAQDEIRLIVRGDDIGSTHAANLGCIRSYTDGIMRTVEVMVPCPWFPEAARLLQEHPGLDVGVHITLTSEWENLKWGPLTHAPGLTDDEGYFFPVIWPNDRFPPEQALKESKWTPEEIEAEMRAQIEKALRNIPQVSHLTCHMGCSGWDDQVAAIFRKLAREYDLDIRTGEPGVERFPVQVNGATTEERVGQFTRGLSQLEKGRTYLFVEHPALDTPEMEAIGHEGYRGVGKDRQRVTDLFTSPQVAEEIDRLGIRLISYADLKK